MKHICTKFVAMLLVIAMIAGVLPFAFAANVGPFTDVKDTTGLLRTFSTFMTTD